MYQWLYENTQLTGILPTICSLLKGQLFLKITLLDDTKKCLERWHFLYPLNKSKLTKVNEEIFEQKVKGTVYIWAVLT